MLLFSDPKFWLSISFLIFLALMLKYLMPKITVDLDNKSKQIADQIADAKKMREQAEELLISAKKHNEDSINYCQKLIEDAKNEASKLLADSQNSLEEELAKKTALAKERIKAEEEKTIREIKSGIIEVVIKNIELRATSFPSALSSKLVKSAIDNISAET